MHPNHALRVARSRRAAKEDRRKELAGLEVELKAAFDAWFLSKDSASLDMMERCASAIEAMGFPKPYKLFLEMNRRT